MITPQNSLTMHLANQLDLVSTQPQSGEYDWVTAVVDLLKYKPFTLAHLSSIYRVFFQDATETHERLCSRELSIFPSP